MKIAFLGDSITLGYSLRAGVRYATLVAQMLHAEEENYGITGTLVAKAGLNREDGKDFVSRLPLIEKADVAVVFGGTNDYFWSDAPISGTGDDVSFENAVDTICRYLTCERAGKLNLIVTPYAHHGVGNYLGGYDFRDSSLHETDAVNYNGHTLADYVRVLREKAEAYGIPCLDLHEDFGFDYRIHTTDGCHPNAKGHALLAKVIGEKLSEIIGKTK